MAVRNLIALLVLLLALPACDQGGSAAQVAAYKQELARTQAQLMEQTRIAEEQKRKEEEQNRLALEHRANIERVLREDQEAGSSGSRRSTVYRMELINLTGTPVEFSSAYVDHLNAWRKSERAETTLASLKSDEQMATATLGGIITTLADDPSTPFSDHMNKIESYERQLTQASAEITSTFSVVKSIAAKYGATLPAKN